MTSDRIEEIQKETPYHNSVSVKSALLKVWNECAQEYSKKDEDCKIQTLLDQLDKWIKSSEEVVEILNKNTQPGIQKTVDFHENNIQTYWNVKQFIEVNFKDEI